MKSIAVTDMDSGVDMLQILTYDLLLSQVDEDSHFYESTMGMMELGREYILHQYPDNSCVPDILIVGQAEFTIDECTAWCRELGYLDEELEEVVDVKDSQPEFVVTTLTP